MAIGAIQALEEAGLKPGKDVFIVSIDAAHGAFVAMLEGKLSCTVECNPLLGPQLMKAVQDYMNGKDLPIRMITSEGVFPASTARRDMATREY
jgi:simple sugar transport system substrate-binding protein